MNLEIYKSSCMIGLCLSIVIIQIESIKGFCNSIITISIKQIHTY